jgi:hypothetical protein
MYVRIYSKQNIKSLDVEGLGFRVLDFGFGVLDF